MVLGHTMKSSKMVKAQLVFNNIIFSLISLNLIEIGIYITKNANE